MLSSKQKGNIIETQIANIITLLSEGNICPSIPIVDDYGIDLIINKRGEYKTLFLQIKSRYVTNNKYKNRLDFQVQKTSFNISKSLYIICVYFNQGENKIDTMWLIPSIELKEKAIELEKYCRIVANRLETSGDKWSKLKVSPVQLIDKLSKLL